MPCTYRLVDGNTVKEIEGIPDSNDLDTLCKVAKFISSGSNRFPARIVMIIDDTEDTICIYYMGIKFNPDHEVKYAT